ncbi:hypothetical protein SAMN05444000_12648 [Shimia gijangensis]|uniref:Uncharacterized protein n=1 Tax=Shimia gijangensis TaxID=1470563 RepID=A0A1M6RU96_9RHOB|nr:hypothetical protein [Shimia gijangensis]SHK36016.1 hypothetical protein SAMN05444000_12648 [Shimia gijangensis]
MKVFMWVALTILALFAVGVIVPDIEETDTTESTSTTEEAPKSATLEVEKLEENEGGTLHEASFEEWSSATDQNRLATAMDWTSAVTNEVELETLGDVGIKEKANELVKCIARSAEEQEDLSGTPAARLGASCIVLLEWK